MEIPLPIPGRKAAKEEAEKTVRSTGGANMFSILQELRNSRPSAYALQHGFSAVCDWPFASISTVRLSTSRRAGRPRSARHARPHSLDVFKTASFDVIAADDLFYLSGRTAAVIYIDDLALS